MFLDRNRLRRAAGGKIRWRAAHLSGLAVGFAVVGGLVTHRESRPGTESTDAVTGWVFLTATSVQLLAHSPHGTEKIHRLLASTLIGATRAVVWLFTTCCWPPPRRRGGYAAACGSWP